MKTYAEQINEHLESGGAVVVSTYTNATQYDKKHAGWFYMDSEDNLRVKQGRSSVCLSYGKQLLVSIKFYVEA